jgi:hypothetical protein
MAPRQVTGLPKQLVIRRPSPRPGCAREPKAMRRTAQDLSRLAGVNDLVTRAVSGHSDIEMQELYSTVRGEEMRKSLTAVVQLVGFT